jgi:hypothetical protein
LGLNRLAGDVRRRRLTIAADLRDAKLHIAIAAGHQRPPLLIRERQHLAASQTWANYVKSHSDSQKYLSAGITLDYTVDMKVQVRRVTRFPSAKPGEVLELSEERLRKLAGILHGRDPFGKRSALRVPVEGFVNIMAVSGSGAVSHEQRRVGVYDLSQTGIAIVDTQAMPAGMKFKVLFPRETGPAFEVMCTARHTRRQGETAYITGAEFGASWMSALGAAITGS